MATVTDNFNRADAGSLGANWTNSVGSMQVAGNKANCLNNGVDNYDYYSGTSFTGDHYSQAVCSGTGNLSLTVRDQGSGNLYLMNTVIGGGNIKIYKLVGGTGYTELGDLGVTVTVGHTYKLEANGSTLKGYDNGAQIGSDVTDGTYTGGAPGIGGVHQTAFWDDWEGGDVGGGGGGGNRRRRLLLCGGR